MITQPVVPRVPLALQASAGVTIDPVTGIVTINPSALPPDQAAAILAVAIPTLPTADPGVLNALWKNDGVLMVSKGS